MGGVSFEDDCEFPTSFSNEEQARTMVLLGKTGNGKSSTGNSIIGRDAFESMFSYAGGTTTCEMQSTTVTEANRVINVIDTPGLFDYFGDVDYIEKEVVKCFDMAKDGIHAVLVVLSLRTRFTREEQGVIESMKKFFGNNISNYMIVVFTSADALEDLTLDDYLRGSPDLLKETLKMCGNRCLLFDNKTKDASKKSSQLQKLLALVDVVVNNNGGKPYTNELFVEMKKQKQKCLTGDGELDALVGSSTKNMSELKEQLKIKNDMVESRLRVTTRYLEEQLAKEHASRLKAETDAKDAHMKYEEEIHILKDKLERARLKAETDGEEEQRKKADYWRDRYWRERTERSEKVKEEEQYWRERYWKEWSERSVKEKEEEQYWRERYWRERSERSEKEKDEVQYWRGNGIGGNDLRHLRKRNIKSNV